MKTTEKVPDKSSRLLSCPWCGSKEIEDAEMPHDQVAMICEQCGAGGPICAYNDQAEEAWNSIKLPGMDDYYLVVNERDELRRCISELGGSKYFEEWLKQEQGEKCKCGHVHVAGDTDGGPGPCKECSCLDWSR